MNYVKGIVTKKGQSQNLPWEVYVPKAVFGKMIRKRFKTRKQAEAAARGYENKVLNRERVPLDPEIHKVVSLFQNDFTAEEFREILERAKDAYAVGDGTIGNIGGLYLADKERALKRGAVSKIFVRDIRVRLPKFIAFFGRTPCRDITQEMIEEFVDHHLEEGKAKRTVKNYLNELSAIFNYGKRKEYVTKNPTEGVSLGSTKSDVGILNPPEIQKLLNASCHYMQVWLMFGAFGGLRSSEISLVDWEDVDLDEGQFYVKGKKNVCAERWITLTPPLKDYCQKILEGDDAPVGPIMGGMTAASIIRRRDKAKKAAGVSFPRNALRHSFASHHLVAHNEPNVTAAEMGHIGPQMTFAAYRKAVKKSQAAVYWTVRVHEPLKQEPVDGRESRWRKAA